MSYLVTGGQGCIGAWVIRRLVRAGKQVVLFDRERQPRRLTQIMTPTELERVAYCQGDIAERAQLERVFAEYPIEYVLHLAALQVPTCQADPALGARVNVVGTLHVLEMAAKAGVKRVVYASSAAVAGRPEDYDGSFTEASAALPHTHYGIFKQCNEGNARVYFATHGLQSIGLRPWAVYGIGRDFGLTSDPTKAIKAAVAGRPFQIQFGGRMDLQYVDDVAGIFIACTESSLDGAHVLNLRGHVLPVEEFVATIERVLPKARGLISHRLERLPIIPDFDDSALRQVLHEIPHTPLERGIAETAAIFQDLQQEGRLPLEDLGPR